MASGRTRSNGRFKTTSDIRRDEFPDIELARVEIDYSRAIPFALDCNIHADDELGCCGRQTAVAAHVCTVSGLVYEPKHEARGGAARNEYGIR